MPVFCSFQLAGYGPGQEELVMGRMEATIVLKRRSERLLGVSWRWVALAASC